MHIHMYILDDLYQVYSATKNRVKIVTTYVRF